MIKARPASSAAVLALLAVACAREERNAGPARPGYAPEFYTSERIEATVIDAETGQPVAGAVVVAIWRQIDVYSERWGDTSFGVVETRTDVRGRFIVHRWGPRMASPHAYIDKRSPELWVLKNEYLAGFFDETGQQNPSVPRGNLDGAHLTYVTLPPNKTPDGRTRGIRARPAEGSSRWHDHVLRLTPATSPKELAASLAAANPFEHDLARKLSPTPNYWKEWEISREALPPNLRQTVPFPPYTLVDYTITRRTPAP